MAQGGFGIEVIGAQELKRALKELGRLDNRPRNTIIRQALAKASKPIRKNARARIRAQSEDTGTLRKSIAIKAKTYRRSGTSVAIIGPRAGFATVDENGRPRDPRFYAHLVELGTDHSAAKPFLVPALENNRQTIINTFRRELPLRLTKLAQKMAKKKK